MNTEAGLPRVHHHLIGLYGEAAGERTYRQLQTIVAGARQALAGADFYQPVQLFSEQDVTLIAYADAFQQPGVPTLATLQSFLDEQAGAAINTVHILPPHPATSDGGFSVADFERIDERFGDWSHTARLARDHRLMLDLVVNHVSVRHQWVQQPQYAEYVIEVDPAQVTSEQEAQIFRPRTTKFYSTVTTDDGRQRTLWTTFSVGDFTDQIDLNYRNPQVLLDMLATNLRHMRHGAGIVRLDAIAYLWKQLGTSCIHLPEVHRIVQIFRDVRAAVQPAALLITETNVPHAQNIAYFGGDDSDGSDEAGGSEAGGEAHMVYNFALPPLVLHAFCSGDASYLSAWAKTLRVKPQTAFFNFLACHDGIGLLGAKGILPAEEIRRMSDAVAAHGGQVSYRSSTTTDGQTANEPYEMCTTWWSALNGPDDDPELARRKQITSHAIMLALQGMPAIYYLSLFGAANDYAGWQRTRHNRDLLREKLDYAALQAQLVDTGSRQQQVFAALKQLIARRTALPAFSPTASQEVLDLDGRVFALLRGDTGQPQVLALHNVSGEVVELGYAGKDYRLEPYGYMWNELTWADPSVR